MSRAAVLLILLIGLISTPAYLSSEESAAQASEESAAQATVESQSIADSIARIKSILNTADQPRQLAKEIIPEESVTEPESLVGTAGKMFKGLALCLGVLLVGLAIYKRVRPQHFAKESRMKVRDRLSLTPKTSLLIVEVDGKEQLIAVGVDAVTALNNLEESRVSSRLEVKELCPTDIKLSA